MKSQGEKSIRPAHLLLGLINEGSGIRAGLLRSLGVSLVQARAALAPPVATQICSFCGRTGSVVKRLFLAESAAGSSTPSSFICDKCVERFHAMLEQP
jgi:ClpX C4-type zinc finger/Clp amino terminal domain, pathogenicity island component